MVAAHRAKYITPREYLEAEQLVETKNEYYDGVIVAMSGASPEHNEISINLIAELHPNLKSGDCRLFGSDIRIHVPARNRYFYSDLSLVCGEPNYEELAGVKSLENPKVIFEILSPSTERFDRGEKFACLQSVDSLAVYVLVSQDQPRIEWYTRQLDGKWLYERVDDIGGVLNIDIVNVILSLKDVFAGVKLDAPSNSSITK